MAPAHLRSGHAPSLRLASLTPQASLTPHGEVGTDHLSLTREDSGHREATQTQCHADGKCRSRTETHVSLGVPCFFIALLCHRLIAG